MTTAQLKLILIIGTNILYKQDDIPISKKLMEDDFNSTLIEMTETIDYKLFSL